MQLGINFFDTSISYNQGRSEAIIGEVVSGYPKPAFISTKVGFDIDFEVDQNHQQHDMLHSPSVSVLEAEDWAKAIDTLKRQGKIRWFGISTSDHDSGVWAIKHGADLLQIEYDLLNPTAEDTLLPLAMQYNVGIMARTPLARGLLRGAGDSRPLGTTGSWSRRRGSGGSGFRGGTRLGSG